MTLNEMFDFKVTTTPASQTGIFFPSFLSATCLPIRYKQPEMLYRLDLGYFSRSGNKTVSPFIEKAWSDLINIPVSVRLTNITSIIQKLCDLQYSTVWEKLFGTYDLEYDPIKNYDMTETGSGTRGLTKSGTDALSFTNRAHNRTYSDTRTPDITDSESKSRTETPNLSTVTDNAVYGFNSSSASPSGKTTVTQSGTQTASETNTNRETGTETTSGTDNTTETGSETHTINGSDSETSSNTLTRSGNIGVTTSQQMLQSEIDLWREWEIFDKVIFPAIDQIAAIGVY